MAGAGYKLFSTGDVLSASDVNLYLQQQTVMVFASAAARTTALASVLAEGMVTYLKDTDVVEIYTGAAWVSLDDPNAIQNSIVTAKGDLIGATASGTPARLAVGNSGEQLVADSSASVGLRYSATPSASNPVINAAFQIWQRGTSFTAAGLTADRWQRGTAPSATYSRQTTSDTTNLPFIQYCTRIQRNSGATATNAIDFGQNFESVNSIPFAGKTVTLSFYARAGANFSSSGSALTAQLYTGTGTDQNIFSGFTGQTSPISQNATLTTTWQRFTFSATLSASATQIALYYFYNPTGTASTNDYYEITGVQLDIGSVALPFRTYAATLQGELAACQRYYFRYDPSASGTSASFSRFGFGSANSTSVARVQISNPVAMRIGAATLDYGSQITLFDGVNVNAVSTLAIDTSTPLATTLVFTASSAGLTQYRPYWLYANSSTTAVVGLSAEL